MGPSPKAQRLVLPTPFPVGPVNAYVLRPAGATSGPVGPLTLVDTGPAWDPAREALRQGLVAQGLAVKDIELIVITHPHLDHYGQAAELARESGARVVAHAEAAPRLGALLHRSREGEEAALEEVMRRAGAPEDFGESLFRQWSLAETLGAGVEVDRTLADGDRLEAGGATWQVLYTPGHSPGSICLYDAAQKRLISGDHLLPHISSNALMEFRADEAEPRPGPDNGRVFVREKSLEIYIDALRRVERLEVREVLPGHGEPFTGHHALIAERMRHYEGRKAAIVEALRRLGPSPAFRVAAALFPGQTEAVGQFLALSEVIGHLDLLEAEGEVRRREDGGVDLYAAV